MLLRRGIRSPTPYRTSQIAVNANSKWLDCVDFSSKLGEIDVVKILLDHRQIKVNEQDKDGCTALMWAAKEGHLEVVNTLINKSHDNELQR